MRSLLLLLIALSASHSQAQEPIRIFAAASLTDALGEVISKFEARPKTRVVPQFGGSSDLARQILAGAPADLFFSADRRQLERVATVRRSEVLSNELVVVLHREKPDTVDTPQDLASIGRIAMADPEAVPAGVYARQYLESQGLWSRVRSRVVPTLDVRGALAAVASGNIEAAFVYRTDAAIDDRVKAVYAVPRDEGPPIAYSLGILDGRDRGDVRAFYDYLSSEATVEVFTRFGFIVLDTDP